jgi:UDP-N-acetylglucosamine 2-epimerase (non-hydrolysing)
VIEEPAPRASLIAVVVGTRPEAIKMSPVVLKLRERPNRFKTVLISTGQHKEMLDLALADFDLSPDYDLALMATGQTLAHITSSAMDGFSELLGQLRPDVVLVQGDTTTAMSCALASFYMRIPVGHVEAGLRTLDRYQPFPEEINRRMITTLATWHYAPTLGAVNRLLSEGVAQDVVVRTGNTVVDALLRIAEQVEDLPEGVRKPYILVTAHRRENLGRPLEQICLALRDLVHRNTNLQIVYPVHPNPAVRDVVYKILQDEPNVQLMAPVSYRSLVALMRGCHMVLTDSGGIQEEAPVFGRPVLVLREVTERPEAVEAGTVRVVGTDRKRIVVETERLLQNQEAYAEMARAVSPYGDGHAADRIVEHLGQNAQVASRETVAPFPG